MAVINLGAVDLRYGIINLRVVKIEQEAKLPLNYLLHLDNPLLAMALASC